MAFPEAALFADVRRWCEFMEVIGRSHKTIRSYRRTLMNFVADTLEDPRSVTEAQLIGYLRDVSPQAGARGMLLRAFRSFFSFYEEADPSRRIPIPRAKLGPAPYLTHGEMASLIAAAACGPDGGRRACAILFAYTTGGRVESLCSVRPQDIREGRVYFWVVKNDDPYSVPLSPIGQQAAQALVRLGNPTLFGVGPGQFWAWVNTAARRAGMKVWPHLLRHTFATHLRQSGTDPVMLSRLLNHRDLSQIRRYAGVADSEEQDAVARAFG